MHAQRQPVLLANLSITGHFCAASRINQLRKSSSAAGHSLAGPFRSDR